MIPLFPFEPRPHQAAIVEAATVALREGGHLVLESGTGTGKTVCALASALVAARERGKRVLYLTRTNAQERQVIVEYRRIRAGEPDRKGVAVALQGRTHLCPLRVEDREMARADSEELGMMCRDRCRAADEEAAGGRPRIEPCRFYVATRSPAGADLAAWSRASAPTAEELAGECATRGLCPYIASRALLPEAELVVAPYVYFFDPMLRRAFLAWCGAGVEDFIVVIDEAHNLPEFARDLGSAELGQGTLELARREAMEFGNVEAIEGFTLTRFIDVVGDVLRETADAFVAEGEEDGLVPPEEIDGELIGKLKVATPRLDKALVKLSEYGAAVRDARRRLGRLPRSYVGALAGFLQFYRRADEDSHVRLAKRDRETGEPRLECYAVDPSVTTSLLLDSAGSLHMSGTLAPLDEYRDSIGLPFGTPCLAFTSPFPPENRLVLFDPDVTTRFEDVKREPDMWARIGQRVQAIRAAVPGRNVAVFAPSYETLERVRPYLAGSTVLAESRGAKQEDVMATVARFKSTRGATLLSVMGGKLSEGLDFPDAELEVAIVVGLPYPRPSARQQALVRFYDRKFGRGFEYAAVAPMTRKLLQSVGRLIRTPTDRGVAIVLDRRAALLRESLPRLASSRVVHDATRAFFDGDVADAPRFEAANHSYTRRNVPD